MRSDRPVDGQASAAPNSDEADVIGDSFSRHELMAQLRRILDSPAFEASERRKRLLRHIVNEALAGRADRLKGYVIATAVFERDESFDPQTDPVVRLEARRLRRALEHYYLTAGGDDPIRIGIPKGGYAPSFVRQASGGIDPLASVPAGANAPFKEQILPRRAAKFHSSQLVTIGLAVGGALLVAAAAAWFQSDRAAYDHVAQAAADRQLAGPGVVISPLQNLTDTEAGRLFAGGLVQDLITDLMRFHDLRVYAAPREKPSNADFGPDPEVRYRVEGSVRRTPDRVRLAVQLIETDSGRYLWSETYDRPLTTENIFDIQAQLAAELARRLAEPYGIIHKVSVDDFRHQRPSTLFAYDCVLRAYAYRRTFAREDYLSARECLEQAVQDDPRYPLAWAMQALAHLDEYRWYGWGPLYRQSAALDRALAAAQRARDLDPEEVMTLSAYAAVQFYRGEFAEAEAAQRRAVALNPNNPEPLMQLGWRMAFAGHWDQGIELVRQAARRGRAGTGWHHLFLAMDHYRRGDYRSGLADLKRLGGTFFFVSPALAAMCEAQLGHPEEARAALQEAMTLDPTFAQDPRAAFRLHHVPEDLIDEFMEGLRRAGLEDPAA